MFIPATHLMRQQAAVHKQLRAEAGGGPALQIDQIDYKTQMFNCGLQPVCKHRVTFHWGPRGRFFPHTQPSIHCIMTVDS